jgi:phosphate transport system substrate-binding protein
MKRIKIVKKYTILSLCLFSCLLALSGCQKTAPKFTIETYPKVDGSTVTIPLSEAVAATLTQHTIEAVRPYIMHYKTHQAYLNLIEKEAELIFVTAPSEEELALAEAEGVAFEIVPIVSEAFVFLTHVDNPVKGLTGQNIQDIYTGKVTRWNELGGIDEAIIPYQRPVNSGSQTGFLDLVMKGLTPMQAPKELVTAEMGQLIDAVANYENSASALGYSYFYFVEDMWGNDNVKLLEVDGVYPDHETISSGEYPFTTAYYAVIREDSPKDSGARQIIEWILSEDGQALMEESGYVKIKK